MPWEADLTILGKCVNESLELLSFGIFIVQLASTDIKCYEYCTDFFHKAKPGPPFFSDWMALFRR